MSFVKELNHVALRTGDMDYSLHFYRDILGGKVIKDQWNPDGKGHIYYVQIVDGVIEIIKGQYGADNLGLQHIAYLIKDDLELELVADELRKQGFRFTVDVKYTQAKDGKLCFFEERSGSIFEFIKRKENIRIPDLKNPYILEFDHISIRIADENKDACADFYLNTLGFKIRRVLERGEQTITYYSWNKDTLETLYSKGRPKDPRPLGHIAFRVADCAAMKTYLESKGIECPSLKESALGGFNILNIKGPDGEDIEFVDRALLEEYKIPSEGGI
jgi:catechol 2,3-dioxygenase-like lactoylglutathione lyase family enzyme